MRRHSPPVLPSGSPGASPIAWHALSRAEVARLLATDPERGLTEAEAARRLLQAGPNRVTNDGGGGPLRLLGAQFTSVLVLMLLVAATVSFVLGEWLDGGTILAIVVLNAVLGFVQEYRAGQALEALRRMAAPAATVIRDGAARRIDAEALVPGDLIDLTAGEATPADARIVEIAGLHVSEAALTGESFPIAKTDAAAAPDAPLAERVSMTFAGTLALGGRARGLVTATGAATEFGRIAELMRGGERRRTPLERGLDRTGRWLAAGALVAAVIVFISVLAGDGDASEAFLTGVALAVAAIPEGLPAAVTIVLALGVQRMAARHAIVRRLTAVETLGSATVICTDKTGTLTRNELSVRQLWCDAGVYDVAEQSATGGAPAEVMRVIALSTELDGAALALVPDPVDVALARLVEAAGQPVGDVRAGLAVVATYPFDSARKRSGAVYGSSSSGRTLVVKGAPEVVAALCSTIMGVSGEEGLDDAGRERIEAAVTAMADGGMRPLAFAVRELPASLDPADAAGVERDMRFIAVAGMMDAIRPEVAAAHGVAARAGVRTIMITGDHPATARAIARDAGFADGGRTLTGSDLTQMDDAEFEMALGDVDVYARVTSEDKLRIVRALRRRGDVVAMTGDGVNDAPALREADIGVAMGRGGTEVAREAADLVLTDDNYASIVAAIEEGRTIFNNIRRFVMYLVAGNLGEIIVVLLGGLSGSAPLLPVQILWVNLVTDGPPALALGLEPAEPGVMDRAPRTTGTSILTRRTLPRIALSSGLIAAPALLAFAIGHDRGGIEEARHFAFGTLVSAHLLTALTFRSGRTPLRRLGLRTNLGLLYAVGAALAMQAVVFYVPPAQAALSTDAFTVGELAVVGALALPSLHRAGGAEGVALSTKREPGTGGLIGVRPRLAADRWDRDAREPQRAIALVGCPRDTGRRARRDASGDGVGDGAVDSGCRLSALSTQSP